LGGLNPRREALGSLKSLSGGAAGKRWWKAVHDALVTRLVLRRQTTDEAVGILVRRFPAVVSLEFKGDERRVLTDEGMRAVSSLTALTSLNLRCWEGGRWTLTGFRVPCQACDTQGGYAGDLREELQHAPQQLYLLYANPAKRAPFLAGSHGPRFGWKHVLSEQDQDLLQRGGGGIRRSLARTGRAQAETLRDALRTPPRRR
jgi:hypothetical protein